MELASFGPDIRTSECERCGEPLLVPVPVLGGAVRCACGHTNVVSARIEDAGDRPSAEGYRGGGEAARIEHLRRQAAGAEPCAYDLTRLMTPDLRALVTTQGDAEALPRLRQELSALRARLRDARSAEAEGRLTWVATQLSRIYATANELPRRRVMLETALDALHDRGFRYMMRCYLASTAARARDLGGAEAWLAGCDPRPQDLQLDSDYRAARARLEFQRGNPEGVLTVTGAARGDVPEAPADAWVLDLYRIDAQEALGHPDVAERLLYDLIGERGLAEVAASVQRGGVALRTLGRVQAQGGRVLAAPPVRLPSPRAPLAPPPRPLTPAYAAYVRLRARSLVGWILLIVGVPGAAPLLVLPGPARFVAVVTLAPAIVGLVLVLRARGVQRGLRQVLAAGHASLANVTANQVNWSYRVNGAPQRIVTLAVDGRSVVMKTFDGNAADAMPAGAVVEVLADPRFPDTVIPTADLPDAAATPRSTFPFLLLFPIGGIALMGGIFYAAWTGINGAIGHTAFALAQLRACPAAVDALGAPIEQPRFGKSLGNARSSDRGSYANWTMAVRGSRASGQLHFIAHRANGPWRFDSAWLTGAGPPIDVAACVAPALR